MQRPIFVPYHKLAFILVVAISMFANHSVLAVTGDRHDVVPRGQLQSSESVPPVPRPIYVYAGQCGALGDVQWPLTNLVSPGGNAGGSTDTDRTEYSFSANVPLTIDQMLAGEFAINVHESGENPDNSLVCGNIGGVPDGLGSLVVGLRPASDLDITGIAVLSPSPANPAISLISVFITGSGLGTEFGTIGVAPIPDDATGPPLVTDPVNPDPGGGDGDDDDDDDDDEADD